MAVGKGNGSGVLEGGDIDKLEGEFVDRMLASAAGLARICALKKCRRRKRCFGRKAGDLLCLRHHKGLGQARYKSAMKRLGWNEDGK